jgi:radical SAM protein with 4Fe4S-binding SPASM domain
MSNSTDVAPRMLSSYRGFNLIAVDGAFCGVPQALGGVDLAVERRVGNPDVIWDSDEAALRRRIDTERLWRWFDPLHTDTPLDSFGPPEVIEIEPIHTCNLRCIMCHVSYEQVTNRRLDPRFLDRLNGLEGKWAKVGSLYEPMAHPAFDRIVSGLTERHMDIDLVTNGTLLTPSLIDRIKNANFANVTFSFDGARAETYERIRRGSRYGQTVERILAFKQAVKAYRPHCIFQINYTVLRSNIDEITEAVDFWEAHGFDHIGFITMVKRADSPLLTDETVEPALDRLSARLDEAARRIIERRYKITMTSPWLRQSSLRTEFPRNVGAGGEGIVVSDHPAALTPATPSTYFQNGDFPGVPVSCRSPFKLARISYDGDVYLCYLFPIGKIYDTDLLTLWNGAAAERVRTLVRQDEKTCHACEYYRFCIKANEVDYDQSHSFVSENQTIQVGHTSWYRFWRWRGDYFAVPRGHGFVPADLADPVRGARLGILRNSDLDGLRREAARHRPRWRTVATGVLQGLLNKLSPTDDLLVAQYAPSVDVEQVGVSWLYRLWHWRARYYAVPRCVQFTLADLENPAQRRRVGVLVAGDMATLRRNIIRHWPGWHQVGAGALRIAIGLVRRRL